MYHYGPPTKSQVLKPLHHLVQYNPMVEIIRILYAKPDIHYHLNNISIHCQLVSSFTSRLFSSWSIITWTAYVNEKKDLLSQRSQNKQARSMCNLFESQFYDIFVFFPLRSFLLSVNLSLIFCRIGCIRVFVPFCSFFFIHILSIDWIPKLSLLLSIFFSLSLSLFLLLFFFLALRLFVHTRDMDTQWKKGRNVFFSCCIKQKKRNIYIHIYIYIYRWRNMEPCSINFNVLVFRVLFSFSFLSMRFWSFNSSYSDMMDWFSCQSKRMSVGIFEGIYQRNSKRETIVRREDVIVSSLKVRCES